MSYEWQSVKPRVPPSTTQIPRLLDLCKELKALMEVRLEIQVRAFENFRVLKGKLSGRL